MAKKTISLEQKIDALTNIVEKGFAAVAVELQEVGGEPGYTVAIQAPGLQLRIPHAALAGEPREPPPLQ